MVIFGVFIISKSGGLIFNMDHNVPKVENEKTFSFPLDLVLEYDAKKVSVVFGERDGICGEKRLLDVIQIYQGIKHPLPSPSSWPRPERCERSVSHGDTD